MNRAYSLLSLKSVDEDKREIVGIATTPETDHVGDVVEPRGAKFKLPIPLLLGHDAMQPIGNVTHATVTDRGIEIRATIARTASPGKVKDRVDGAWHDIKLGLMRGLSIGFSPLKSEPLKSGGRRFLSWAWHELSAVVIAANAGAAITAIKAADRRSLSKSRRSGVVYLDEPAGASRLRDPHPGSVSLTKRRNVRKSARHEGAVRLDRDRSPGSFDR